MRTIIFYLALLLASLIISFTSKAQQTPLHLKENEEFIYEWDKSIINREKFDITGNDITKIRYSLVINKKDSSRLLFTTKILQDISGIPSYRTNDFIDYGFPPLTKFQELTPGQIGDFWVNEILYQMKFHFELNLATRSVKLINRNEILEHCYSYLTGKGYPDALRSLIIDQVNKYALKIRAELFLLPFTFIDTNIDQPIIHFQRQNVDLSVLKKTQGSLELVGARRVHLSKFACKLDLQNGLLTHLIKVSDEKEPQLIPDHIRSSKYQMTEQFSLLRKTTAGRQNVIVCGHIENRVSDQMVLYFMNKAFGNYFDSKTVATDKDGNFRIETKLEQNGLLLILNHNKNQNVRSAPIILYAEPGDSLFLDARLGPKQFITKQPVKADSFATVSAEYIVPEKIVFSGDRKKEGELLNKFQGQVNLVPFEIANNKMFFLRYCPDVGIYLGILEKLKRLMDTSRSDLPSESANYIDRELQAYIYTYLFDARTIDTAPGLLIYPLGLIVPENLKNQLQNQLDTFNINRIYNDYGIFSRNLTHAYVGYKYRRLLLRNNSIASLLGLGWNRDPEQSFQFTRLVLNGSEVYREAAGQLFDWTINRYHGDQIQFEQWDGWISETLKLMIERCNDKVFTDALKAFHNDQFHWNNKNYIPDAAFLNLKKKVTPLKTFIKEKPTIIYSSNEWSVGRYEMDDFARKYPAINFVLINGGSNFVQWKDWNTSAEPVAHQLFLVSDSVRLQDIFLDKFNKYIIYNRLGEKIGVTENLEKAVSIAKESLKPQTKEINKSTLQGIIIFLAGSMLFFLILFLLYKYRMKQRLKKQTQEKQLRELQMAAIRSQMNPHFLFNSLNSVQNLVQQNRAREAHLYLSDFAGLIRKVLRDSDKEEVSLAEELETLEQYLKLEQLRFDFEYQIEIDPGIEQSLFMLPSLILQPVAENALLHGLQHKKDNRKLLIQISKLEHAIRIVIEDNGIGIEAAKKIKGTSNGVGLRMNEDRIRLMNEKYGGNYSFRLIDLSIENGEGTRVEIVIPEED